MSTEDVATNIVLELIREFLLSGKFVKICDKPMEVGDVIAGKLTKKEKAIYSTREKLKKTVGVSRIRFYAYTLADDHLIRMVKNRLCIEEGFFVDFCNGWKITKSDKDVAYKKIGLRIERLKIGVQTKMLTLL